MPTNKHAQIRYAALDRCFSDPYNEYYFDDMKRAVDNAISDYTGERSDISRRQIFADIAFLCSKEGWNAPLKRYHHGKQVYYRYSDDNYSIRNQALNKKEVMQLKSTIYMLNRFCGMPQFEWMNDVLLKFQKSFGIDERVDAIVYFEQNVDLVGLKYFTPLFDSILRKEVLEVHYKRFGHDEITMTIHPYFLKQYNNRWYLFGHNPQVNRNSQLTCLPLDRIVSFRPTEAEYIGMDKMDVDDYFYDVIGVTMIPHEKLVRVKLKIDNRAFDYFRTKPLHPTQRVISKDGDSVTIEIKVIPNFELESKLMPYADMIEVLCPEELRESIRKRAEEILKRNRKA